LAAARAIEENAWMRRLIVSNVMSLDGFFEDSNKKLDWFVVDEEFFDYAREMLRSVDTILFGRATYEHMAAYWPSAPPDEIAEKMNNLPKVVISRTLQQADWNNSMLVKGDLAEEIANLKQLPGKDIVIFGSAMLASSLLQMGLIDEYRIILTPVLIGDGHPLFRDIRQPIKLKLTKTRLLRSGVIVLYYQ
jgi:dihydrofolate reductase